MTASLRGIESGEPNVLLQVAQRTDDLTAAAAWLRQSGLFEHESGLQVQLIRYDPDSPDLPGGGA